MTGRKDHQETCCTYGIVPPFILEAIAENGDERQRAIALNTLAYDRTVRERRVESFAGLLTVSPVAATRRNRRIYTGSNTPALPGTLLRSENESPSGDPEADEVYDGLGSSFDLYSEVFNRNSWN